MNHKRFATLILRIYLLLTILAIVFLIATLLIPFGEMYGTYVVLFFCSFIIYSVISIFLLYSIKKQGKKSWNILIYIYLIICPIVLFLLIIPR